MRKLTASLAAAAILAASVAAPAAAQRGGGQGQAQSQSQRQQGRGDLSRSDQANARQEMQAGRTMPSREIERRIVPQMKGKDYLGFEYDSAASAYRLKFLEEGQVTWVDVDARTGKILRIAK